MDEQNDIDLFLQKAGWHNTQIEEMPADFSSRRYARLRRTEDKASTAYLMQADQEQKPEIFVALANVLRSMEISTPEIYAVDYNKGLVLMEDFGSQNFGGLMDKGSDPTPLYRQATDLLIHLHEIFTLDHLANLSVPVFDAPLFADQTRLFLDGYWPLRKGEEADMETRLSFRNLWIHLLPQATTGPQTLLLRDYMPDNLMLLPNREGWKKTGLLDFQDAGIGPEAYDVASLAECVRRDQREDFLDAVITIYDWHRKVQDRAAFHRACTILSAQRHIRILGNVAKRPAKHAFLPRIENYLRSLMADDALTPLKIWCHERNILT